MRLGLACPRVIQAGNLINTRPKQFSNSLGSDEITSSDTLPERKTCGEIILWNRLPLPTYTSAFKFVESTFYKPYVKSIKHLVLNIADNLYLLDTVLKPMLFL